MTTKIATLLGLIGVSLLILSSFMNLIQSLQYREDGLVTSMFELLGFIGILLFFIHLQSKQK